MTPSGIGISANFFLMIEFDFFHFSPRQVLEVCEERLANELAAWEKEAYEFIKEWYAPTPHIQAHTSGSTGTPKPIRLEKYRMEASAHMTGAYLDLEPGDTALLCLPLQFIAGKMMMVRAMVLRLRITIIKPQSSPLENLSGPIHFSAMVPNQVFGSLDDLEKIETLLIGGGPIHRDLTERLESMKGRIYHTYGMTETITHVAMRQLNGGGYSPYFEALPGVTFQSDDRSCLVIEAPHLLDEELATNDLVELINPHQFVWRGRYDNVIISGGVKIIPEELERELGKHISHRFFITGLEDPQLGQKVVIVVEGPALLEPEIGELIGGVNLPRFHQPKKIYVVSSFEETSSGKIQRSLTLKKAGIG